MSEKIASNELELFDLIKSGVNVPENEEEKNVEPVKYFSSDEETVVTKSNIESELDENRTLSPVSVEEKKSVQKSIRAFNIIVSNKQLLQKMKPCYVKLPKDKSGDLLHKIQKKSICKSNERKQNDSGHTKQFTSPAKSLPKLLTRANQKESSSKNDLFKTPSIDCIATQNSYELSRSPKRSSLKRLKSNRSSSLAKARASKSKNKNKLSPSRSDLLKQFDASFFKCHVRVMNIKNPNSFLQLTPKKSHTNHHSHNKSVSFCDTVELLGEMSNSESDEDENINGEDASPINSINDENGKVLSINDLTCSTPKEYKRITIKSFSPLKSGEDCTQTKEVLKQANEKMPSSLQFADVDNEEDDIKPSVSTKKNVPSSSEMSIVINKDNISIENDKEIVTDNNKNENVHESLNETISDLKENDDQNDEKNQNDDEKNQNVFDQKQNDKVIETNEVDQEQNAEDDKMKDVDQEQSAKANEMNVVDQEQSDEDEKMNVVDQEQNVVDQEQNVVDQEQNVVDQEQNVIHQEQNVVDQEQNAEDNEMNVVDQQQNAEDNEMNVVNPDQNAENDEMNVVDQQKNAEDNDMNVVNHEQNAEDNEMNIVVENDEKNAEAEIGMDVFEDIEHKNDLDADVLDSLELDCIIRDNIDDEKHDDGGMLDTLTVSESNIFGETSRDDEINLNMSNEIKNAESQVNLDPDTHKQDEFQLIEAENINVSEIIQNYYDEVGKASQDLLNQMETDEDSDDVPKDSLRCTEEDENEKNILSGNEDGKLITPFDDSSDETTMFDPKNILDDSNESIFNESTTYEEDVARIRNKTPVKNNDEQNSDKPRGEELAAPGDFLSGGLDSIDSI